MSSAGELSSYLLYVLLEPARRCSVAQYGHHFLRRTFSVDFNVVSIRMMLLCHRELILRGHCHLFVESNPGLIRMPGGCSGSHVGTPRLMD